MRAAPIHRFSASRPPSPRWRPVLRRVRTSAALRRAVFALALVALPASAQTGRPLATTPVGTLAEALASAPAPSASPPASRGVRPPGSAFSVGYDAQYRSINVAADAAGGQHAIWATQQGAPSFPVVYAYCAPGADCGARSAWSTTPIGLDDFYFLQLEVTPDGRPRVLAHESDLKIPGLPFATRLVYAACESACLSRSNWTTTALWTADNGQGYHASDFQPEYFALDADGRPRLVYTQSIESGEAYYAGCDAGCTDRANWWRRPMPAEGYDDYETADLEIGPDGRPRLLTTASDQGATVVAYAECATAACPRAADWEFVGLVVISPDGYCGGGTEGCHASLDLAPDGTALIALQGPTSNVVAGWCTGDCLDGASWGAIGFSGVEAAEHPVAAVDGAGRFYVALQQWTETGGAVLAWCTSGCTGDSPSWEYETVDASRTLQDEFTIPPPSLCLEGDWQVGFRPSVAFLPDGHVTVGHDGEYLMLCSDGTGSWSYEARWRTPRIATLPSPLGVADEPGAGAPDGLRLAQPAPNPTRGVASIAFTLDAPADVALDVVDVTGRVVAGVARGAYAAGPHRVTVDASALAPGVYVVRLRAGAGVQTQRLSVVR